MEAISLCGNVSASSSSMGFSVTQSGSFSDSRPMPRAALKSWVIVMMRLAIRCRSSSV